jgi:hypothetical protein
MAYLKVYLEVFQDWRKSAGEILGLYYEMPDGCWN